MGSVYPRGNVLWLAFVDASGKRRCRSSGLLVGNEKEAASTLKMIERQISAEARNGEGVEMGPPTVAGYARRFVKRRKVEGVGIAGIEGARFESYVFPFIADGTPFGEMRLKDVRPHHVRDFVRHLRAREPALAPRTIRHIYGQLRVLFHEAVTDELISATPCALKKNELPKKIDKDPTWRESAVFSRGEVEQLVSDERIPAYRRVRYSCLFLTGMRIGELSARTWRHVDFTSEPLGRVSVATSFDRKGGRIKSVKTERPRQVPIHPTLARALAAWKLSGWAAQFGRAPTPDDLLCPSATLENLRDTVVLREFHADCDAVGIRRRRTHDTRRTFISLARADGANKDILRQVTHQPEGDQVDEYTTLPWASLCAEVSKLKIQFVTGQLLGLPVAVNGGSQMKLLQSQLQSNAKSLKAVALSGVVPGAEVGRGGTRTLTLECQQAPTDTKAHNLSGACDETASSSPQRDTTDRSNVAAALSSARAQWLESGDAEALRAALLEVLAGVTK